MKAAHIAANPHVTFSYRSPAQSTVAVDTVAAWTGDAAERAHVWDLHRHGSPPGAGYDPAQFWSGGEDSRFQVLRLTPWRVQVLRRRDLVSGVPARIWRSPREEAVGRSPGAQPSAV